ncbi:hypothetical protein ACGK9U_08285 [Mariniflexile sp. HNIBRBA6329]|uniref:hypothetical protein n=1 Tax=Mariniflexile sp. HNIBRBA6329 TaxID=3373088 RepID=UPI003746C532
MEPNKFENSIKEKLEARRLQPSKEAWAKLQERLEQTDDNKNNKAFWWLGIAASAVGVLFVAFQFFNIEEVKPVVVDAPTVIQQKETTQVAVEEVKKTNEVLKEENSIDKIEKHAISKNFVAVTKEQVVPEEKNQIATLTVVVHEKLTFEEQKIQDVVAKVNELKNQNKEVTDAVIDALLLEAQKEIRLKKMYNSNAGIVDATMLLQEVEADLDQSFRSKVFDAIKASYNSVKTAVAQRNN